VSEFRWDPLKCTWAITANHREKHPREFFVDRQQVTMTTCPFCPGQEDKTPPEVYASRYPSPAAGGPDWRVRVVPNKFPLLHIEGELNRHPEGIYQVMEGIGAHEVIIETPRHDQCLADLDVEQLTCVLQAYRARLIDLQHDKRFRYLQIFKNYGVEAGAPVSHSHSQLMAVPITSPVIKTELNACRSYFRANERCLICDLIAQDTADGRRIVYNDGHFVVVAPYASISPFELRLFPLRHSHDFALQSDSELSRFAVALLYTFQRLRSLLRDPPYNFFLHTAPPTHPRPGRPDYWASLPFDFHWHLEVVPRLKRIAGFEWGSGMFINSMPPELAALHLRNVDPTDGL
jgi:UDPglucose--hexose-1-phosphate uridylyltransferase